MKVVNIRNSFVKIRIYEYYYIVNEGCGEPDWSNGTRGRLAVLKGEEWRNETDSELPPER
ncbi:MAG: hypothetical protein ACK5HT_06280 [Draconibacterium sp.]